MVKETVILLPDCSTSDPPIPANLQEILNMLPYSDALSGEEYSVIVQ